jgi:hypothetical protein
MMMFLLGTFVGFYLGLGLMCILAVSKRADERSEEMMRNQNGQSN